MKQHSITLLFLFILIAGTPTSAQESDLSATSQGSIEVLDGEVEIEAVEYWDNGALAGMTLWGVGVVAVTIPPEGTEDPEASVIDYIVDIRPARSRDPEERFTAQVAGSASETVVPSRLLSLRSYWIECVGPIWYQNRNLEFVLRPKEGGEDVSIYKIPFDKFGVFLIGLSGETPIVGDRVKAAQANGMFHVSRILYLSGFNIAYYDEDMVVGRGLNTGLGRPFQEVREQIKHCGIYSVGIFGHSRGGGATHNLSWRLEDERRIIDAVTDFTIRYTAYVDAIKADSFESEDRFPPAARFLLNYYQTVARLFEGNLRGTSVVGAENHDLTEMGFGHTGIDNSGYVIGNLSAKIVLRFEFSR